MTTNQLNVDAHWSRPLISDTRGEADLLIRITAPDAPPRGDQRAPLDIAFVIDRSGSMSGEAIRAAKEGVRVAIDQLDQRDRAAVVIYDDQVDVIHQLLPVNAATRGMIASALGFVDARGSTNLGEGWLIGCQQIAAGQATWEPRRMRRTILLTDGQANVGMVDPGQLSKHAGNLRQRGVTTTTLGFGDHFDEQLLSAMAEAGGGNFEYIRTPAQLAPFFARELGELLNATAIGLTLRVTLPPGLRGTVISQLPHERHDKTFEITIGDIPAGESVDVLLNVTTRRGRAGEPLPVAITAGWVDPASDRDAQWAGAPATLTRAADTMVEAARLDPEVAEKAALQRAANAQREALRLDREGRHAESRARMQVSHAALASAPPTDRVLQEMELIAPMASAPADAMYDEYAHKRTASRVSRMGRGRRDRDESLADE